MIFISFVTFAEFFRGYGKVITAMQGSIYSRLIPTVSEYYYRPGSTHLYYENDLDCLWTIIGKKNNIILLKFMRMNIEYAYDCKHDYIYVSETSDYRIYAIKTP